MSNKWLWLAAGIVIGAYVIHYHHRPHSRLDYRTPLEVAATWNDGGQPHLIPAA